MNSCTKELEIDVSQINYQDREVLKYLKSLTAVYKSAECEQH